MGARGPKPTPTALRLLKGDRKDRMPVAEPKPEPGVPEPPVPLTTEARAEWDRVTPILMRTKVLTEADGAALAGYCETFALWVATGTLLKSEGLLCYTAAGTPKLHPYFTANAQARAAMLRFLSEFGLTPSSRSKVTAVEAEEKDPLAEMMRRRRKDA